MPLSGRLGPSVLPDVLRVIETSRYNGALFLNGSSKRAIIYFSGGEWLAVERVGARIILAQQLVRSGIVTAEEFEAILGVPLAQSGGLSDMQVVRALVGAGVLTEEHVRAFATDDAVKLLASVLSWTEGDFVFEDDTPPPSGKVAFPLPASPLLAQALRLVRTAAPPRTAALPRDVVPLAPETVVDFAEVDPDGGAAVQVSPSQWKLLTAVDGQAPLWAIIQRLQAPEPVILRLAAELLSSGVVVIAGRVAPASEHAPDAGVRR
jgi:hypothetical protein